MILDFDRLYSSVEHKQRKDLHDMFYEYLCKKIGTSEICVISIDRRRGIICFIKHGSLAFISTMATRKFVDIDYAKYSKLNHDFAEDKLKKAQRDFVVDAILEAAKHDILRTRDNINTEYKNLLRKGTTLESFAIDHDLNCMA